MFTFQPVLVDTGTPDDAGLLVFRHDKLVAVAVKLETVDDPTLRGCWNLEAVFDRLPSPRRPFADRDELAAWLVEHGSHES